MLQRVQAIVAEFEAKRQREVEEDDARETTILEFVNNLKLTVSDDFLVATFKAICQEVEDWVRENEGGGLEDTHFEIIGSRYVGSQKTVTTRQDLGNEFCDQICAVHELFDRYNVNVWNDRLAYQSARHKSAFEKAETILRQKLSELCSHIGEKFISMDGSIPLDISYKWKGFSGPELVYFDGHDAFYHHFLPRISCCFHLDKVMTKTTNINPSKKKKLKTQK